MARIQNLDRLLRRLRQAPQAQRDAIRLEVKRSALNIQSGARRRSPIDTGRLRNSITHELADDGLAARIGTNVDYAPFHEFGTRKMAARPFLLPALEEELPRFRKRLQKAIRKAHEGLG